MVSAVSANAAPMTNRTNPAPCAARPRGVGVTIRQRRPHPGLSTSDPRWVNHAEALDVRNDRSAASTPRRRVAREVSCSRRIQPLHLADEQGDVVLPAGQRAPAARGRRASPDRPSRAQSRRPARRRCAWARSAASRPSARTSSRPSASVATIGFPIASVSNAVSGVPSQSDGNTTKSNADSVAGDIAPEACEDEPVAEPERRGLRLQIAKQRALAHEKESRRRAFARPRARLRRRDMNCPSIREAASSCRSRTRRRRCPSRAARSRSPPTVRSRLNSSSGTPRYTTFTFDAGISRAPDHEVGRALRHGEGDVGRRLEAAVGDLLDTTACR